MKKVLLAFLFIGIGTTYAQTIHRTACNGDEKRLDSLLKTTDINVLDENGRTPLLYATGCRNGSKAFDLLISRGADVNIGDKNGLLPILFAIRSQNNRFIDSLLAHNVNVNITDKYGDSPMQLAVMRGNLSLTKKLINNKTTIDAVNKRGTTALEMAIREGFDSIAEFLITKGADRNKVRKFTLKGKYLGQSEPDLIPKMFAPNVVSTEVFTHTGVFHPNMKEFYYTAESQHRHGGTIMISKLKNGVWTIPKPSNIPGDYREIDPFITQDGTKMFFSSSRTAKENDTIRNIDMWMMHRKGNSWGEPVHLGIEVNTKDADWFPTVSNKGTLVFSPSSGRESSIVYSIQKNGVYQKPIAFGKNVNSEKAYNYDPLIAPDESFLIFSSRREGGLGGPDLYICFKKDDGTWTEAKNMGDTINSKTADYAPSLSPDGKYFFFTSNIAGGSDIYWVSSKVIDNLRE
jgi:hypothetical protein